MWLIFLDDERKLNDVTWENYSDKNIILSTTIRDYNSFINFINNLIISNFVLDKFLFSFDHDLGNGKNGYDCAKYLINSLMDNNISGTINFIVHSKNPVGKENIQSLLTNYNQHVGSN